MEERIAKRSRKYIAQYPVVEIEKERTKVVSERRLIAEQHGLRLSAAEVLWALLRVRTFSAQPAVAAEKNGIPERAGRHPPTQPEAAQSGLRVETRTSWEAFPGPTLDAAANNKLHVISELGANGTVGTIPIFPRFLCCPIWALALLNASPFRGTSESVNGHSYGEQGIDCVGLLAGY